MGKTISFSDIQAAAGTLGIHPCMVKAVAVLESAGKGFTKEGNVVVRFEKHVFLRQLSQMGADNQTLSKAQALRGSGLRTYLDALRIDNFCAKLSTSYGMFQIMGFNHESAGFVHVHDFVKAMERDEHSQLQAFINFIKNNNLARYMKGELFAEFARRYNGPGYKANNYDTKLRAAYLACRKGS